MVNCFEGFSIRYICLSIKLLKFTDLQYYSNVANALFLYQRLVNAPVILLFACFKNLVDYVFVELHELD